VSYVPSKVLTKIAHLGLRKATHMTTKYKLMTSLAFSAAFLTAFATMPNAQAEMHLVARISR